MKAERGSAIVYVFIGIVLFGVLMFVFSKGGNQNTSTLTDQQAKMLASDMLEYSRSVETAVSALLSKGCSENELSFENSSETGYANASSPADKSCRVFDAAGGRLQYKYPPAGAETSYITAASPGWHNYGFNGNMRIGTLGTNATELIIWTQTNKKVCDQINAAIGRTTANDTFGDGILGVQFTGTFASSGPGIIGDEAYTPALSKGCFNRPTYSGQYIFYSTLIIR